MEVVLLIILVPLSVALIIAPFLAWIAFFRTRHVKPELKRLKEANNFLSQTVRLVEQSVTDNATALAEIRDDLVAAKEHFEEVLPATAKLEDLSRDVVGLPLAEAAEPELPEPAIQPEPEATAEAIQPEKTKAVVKEEPAIAAAEVEAAADAIVSVEVEAPPNAIVIPEAIPSVAADVAEKTNGGTERAEEPAEPKEEKLVAEPLTAALEVRGKSFAQVPKQRRQHSKEIEPVRTEEVSRSSRLGQTIGKLVGGTGEKGGDWETQIGRNWLNILGIIVLVVGLVLLIQQSLLLVTPAGKILIGVGMSAILMASGTYLRRKNGYQVFAFTLIGGGWGLLYFTAFAAYNIEAAKIIENEYLAMLALLVVAAGIIAQSFSYGRQSVTGLAYGLAFLALHLSPLSIYSLVATAVLAATIPFVVGRTDWRQLGIVIAVATYATHARWLWATELAASPDEATLVLGGLDATQAFWGNIAILSTYWVIFCVTAIAHRPEDENSRMLDLATSLINMVGFIGLVAWQFETYLPGNLHYIAPPAIIAYVANSIVDRRMERPVLSRLNGTIAIVLYVIALPIAIEAENLSWNWLAPYWTVGGLVVWEVARRISSLVYRGQAYALCVLAVAAAAGINLSPDGGADSWLFFLMGLTPVILTERILEFLNSNERPGAETGLDHSVRKIGVIAMPLISGLAAWWALPDHVAGLGMFALAVVMFESGARTKRPYLRFQGYLLGIAGSICVLMLDVVAPPLDQLQEVRSVLLATAALGYFAGLRIHFSGATLLDAERSAAWMAPAFSTVFVAGFAYRWLSLDYAQIAWIAWALVLIEAGQRLQWKEIRFEGYLLGVAGLISVLVLDVVGPPLFQFQEVHTVLLASAVLGYVAGLRMYLSGATLLDAERSAAWVAPAFSVVFVAGAAYRWLPLEQVQIVWVVWALVLLEAGQRLQWKEIRFQSYGLFTVASLLSIGLQDALWSNGFGSAPWYLTAFVSLLLHAATVRMIFPAKELLATEGQYASAPLAAAGVLFAAATWEFCPSYLVAVVLAGWALAIQEFGRWTRRDDVALISTVMGVAAFGLAVVVNVYGIIGSEAIFASLNWLALAGTAAAMYALHFRAVGSVQFGLVMKPTRPYWFLHLGTLLMALALWRELPSVAVAVAWGALAFGLIEASERIENRIFARQAQVLIMVAVIRLFFANFTVPGEAFGISHRLITVGGIIALVYYMRALMAAGWQEGIRLAPTQIFSWVGAGLLVILARFEVGREYAVTIWSILILIFAFLGTRLPDQDFRYQAYLLCVLVFGRVWSTNAYLEGTIWGISERVATTLPSLVALLIVVFLIPRSFEEVDKGKTENLLSKFLLFADRHSRAVVALLFASQLTLLVFYEMTIDLVSIGWAISALFLLVIGFALNERSLRLYGLGLLLVCLLKVVFVDLEGVETIYRVFSFIVLGLVLLLASFGYSRFRDTLERYL